MATEGKERLIAIHGNRLILDLPPDLRQVVKTQNPLNGE
jgi:hypothetical protein